MWVPGAEPRSARAAQVLLTTATPIHPSYQLLKREIFSTCRSAKTYSDCSNGATGDSFLDWQAK